MINPFPLFGVTPEYHQAIDQVFDATRRNVVRGIEEAANELPKSTKALVDLQGTVAAMGEMAYSFLDSQKEVATSIQSAWNQFPERMNGGGYWIGMMHPWGWWTGLSPKDIGDIQGRGITAMTDSLVAGTRMATSIINTGIEAAKTSTECARRNYKDIARILSSDDAVGGQPNEHADKDIAEAGSGTPAAASPILDEALLGVGHLFPATGKVEGDKQVAMEEEAKKPNPESSQVEEQVLERYPYTRFPSEVVLESIIPLDIIIKTTRTSTDKDLLKIIAREGEREVPVDVIVYPGTFEIQGEEYYRTISVPVKPEDSIPVTFFLKAKKEGPQIINVRFFQQGLALGKLIVNTLVVSSPKKIQNPSSQAISAEWRFPRKIYPTADITLYIIERPDSGMKYDILLTSADLPLTRIGPIPFKDNPEEKFRSMIRGIEQDLKLPANVIENRIRAKGITLYDEIFPEALKNLYWEKRETIKSIRVISAEPWIPWEIVKPYRKAQDGKMEEDPFLCERYSFSRWIMDINERPEDKQLKKAVLIAPSNTDLEHASQEVRWFNEFTKKAGMEEEEISHYEEVIYALENQQFDLLHLTSHGFYNPGNSLESALKLGNGGEIRPDEISGTVASFGRFKPVVILNACQTGALGFSLTKTMGWSKTFIEAGSSVFIGTAWSITDKTAAKFVTELYNELNQGTTLGEAVRKARNRCKSRGDPSWLAYQLYGHPHIKVKFGGK